MELSNRYKRVPCLSIQVDRPARQRRDFETTDLDDSIRQRGVYNPVIVEQRADGQLWLIAGERRLASSIKVGLPDIPIRYAGDLTPTERQIIELEENLRRLDLEWKDEVKSISTIHDLYSGAAPEWNQEKTAQALGMTTTLVSHYLRVARELSNPRIADAPGFKAALNMLTRQADRAVADAVSTLIEAGPVHGTRPGVVAVPGGSPAGSPPDAPVVSPETSILNESFLSWAATYRGPKFNLIHCDFPYGIEVFGGDWSGRRSGGTYDDKPEVYWALIECLGANLDNIMAHSGHMVFWFSMDQYTETQEELRRHLPSVDFQRMPLVWHKTDNAGIVSDPKRRPRNVYETALLGSRSDRPLVRTVSNAYGAPTDKTHHPHTKPVPVLNHFLGMLVDENTRLLDPTCGGGSSLRSAEHLGAKFTLGLELDKDHCEAARAALKQFRVLRKARV